MSKTKIYLNNGIEEYKLKKDKYNELLKTIDNEAIKKIVSGINIMLKEIYC